MTSVTEQGTGIGRTAAFLLMLVSLFCIGLIGGAGYIKYQMDRTTYNLMVSLSETTQADNNVSVEQSQQVKADNIRKRQVAERDLHSWSLALTFISWVSLIFVAGLIISMYIVLQRRQSPALRALGQSISNLARGDMQTPIWGIERHDAIGELARSVDLARYHFSQLPDMSLMSDQGPVRIKFEGGARTLFEAMMQQITTQATRVGEEAADLAATAASQHKVLTELPLRLNSALDSLQKLDKTNSQIIQRATQSLTSAASQMETLVPYMQSRAQNMAEVTQIAGTQVTSTIKNLMDTEESLRINAGTGQKAMDDLAASAKEMNDRIFATLNLLQASGKVLTETTESSQSSLKEIVETLGRGEAKLGDVVDRVEQRLEATAQAETSLMSLTERAESRGNRMDEVIQSMAERHDKLSEQITTATERLDGIIGSFNGAQQAMSEALQNINRDGGQLNNVFLDLKTSNEQILAKLSRTSETGHEVVQHLAECSQKLMDQLQDRLATQTQAAQEQLATMVQQHDGLTQQVDSVTENLSHTVTNIENAQTKFQTVQDRFAEMIHRLGGDVEKQVADSFNKTEDLSRQNLETLSSLTSSVDQALQRLSVLGQLTNTLGTVAGQLGQLIPTLGGAPVSASVTQAVRDLEAPAIDIEAIASKLTDELTEHFQALINQIKPPKPVPVVFDTSQIDTTEISDRMLGDFEERWKSSVNQIDSVRDDLASLMERQKDHLEMRLVLLDKQVKSISANKTDPTQIALLQDIVDGLSAMNAHLAHISTSDDGLGSHDGLGPDDHTPLFGGHLSS